MGIQTHYTLIINGDVCHDALDPGNGKGNMMVDKKNGLSTAKARGRLAFEVV